MSGLEILEQEHLCATHSEGSHGPAAGAMHLTDTVASIRIAFAIAYLSGVASRSCLRCVFAHARYARFPNEDYLYLLCGLSHERGGLIVSPLIELKGRIAP